MEYKKIQCENPDYPECLCAACMDFFENGIGLFDDLEEDSLNTYGGD